MIFYVAFPVISCSHSGCSAEISELSMWHFHHITITLKTRDDGNIVLDWILYTQPSEFLIFGM